MNWIAGLVAASWSTSWTGSVEQGVHEGHGRIHGHDDAGGHEAVHGSGLAKSAVLSLRSACCSRGSTVVSAAPSWVRARTARGHGVRDGAVVADDLAGDRRQ